MTQKQSNSTTQQVKAHPNPTGKGGFKDHPELINPGGRPKNSQRYDYWLQHFKDMLGSEFKKYLQDRPFDTMYMAEQQAYRRMNESVADVKTWQVVADRTEGKAPSSVDITSNGNELTPVVVKILHGTIESPRN